jgi:hypothetical protein
MDEPIIPAVIKRNKNSKTMASLLKIDKCLICVCKARRVPFTDCFYWVMSNSYDDELGNVL